MPPSNDCYGPPYLLETWKGKPLPALSKKELIIALQALWKSYRATTDMHINHIGDLARLIPHKLPWWQRLF